MHVPRVETSWVFRMCWGPIYVHLASFSIVATSTIRGTFVSIQRVSWPIWSLQKTSPKLLVRCDGFRALFDLCELHSMSSFQTLHTKRLNYMDSTVSLITAALLFWIHVTCIHWSTRHHTEYTARSSKPAPAPWKHEANSITTKAPKHLADLGAANKPILWHITSHYTRDLVTFTFFSKTKTPKNRIVA